MRLKKPVLPLQQQFDSEREFLAALQSHYSNEIKYYGVWARRYLMLTFIAGVAVIVIQVVGFIMCSRWSR